MSTTVVINGLNYYIPAVGENNWGQNVSDALIALAAALSGGGFFSVVTVTSTPITVVSGRTYLVDTSSAKTLNLPAPALGAYLLVRDKSGLAGTNNITIHPFASETIDGVSGNKLLKADNGVWWFVSDGTNWYSLTGYSIGDIVLTDTSNGNTYRLLMVNGVLSTQQVS